MISAQCLKKMFRNSHQICTQRSHDNSKTNFESCDLDLIFKVTDGFFLDGSICNMVFANYLRKFMKFCPQKHQGKANTNIELGKLDLIFKVTETIQNGFRSICEETFDVSLPDLVHRSNMARQKTC